MPHRVERLAGRTLAALGLGAATLALAGCGGDSGPGSGAAREDAAGGDRQAASDLEHIHGLGVGPRDGTLLVATHFGLFSARTGSTELRRVGDSRQDIMGFSIAGAGRFIGSGHPEPQDTELPPNLGLIESTDGGRSWRQVSLTGEADFHVLESDGERVYGFDGGRGRLMVSDDGGESFRQRRPPAPVFDLAIDPVDADHVVVATELGLFESRNAGADWRPLSRELAGLLAWPSKTALHVIDGTGAVRTSRNGGRAWRAAGSLGGQPVAFASHGSDLFAALGDGSVRASADGGRTWALRAAP